MLVSAVMLFMQKTLRLAAAVALEFWKQSVSITQHTKPHNLQALVPGTSHALRGNTVQKPG